MTTILLHPTAYRAATDEQLVALVRAGDDRAFQAIHDRYQPRLQAFARHLLGGAHHDAEEVVQDAFVRALAALRADEREMALKAWLFTIVRNRALDVLRRPARTTDLEPHVAHDRVHLAVHVLPQPRDDRRGVQAARVCQSHFLLRHRVAFPILCGAGVPPARCTLLIRAYAIRSGCT